MQKTSDCGGGSKSITLKQTYLMLEVMLLHVNFEHVVLICLFGCKLLCTMLKLQPPGRERVLVLWVVESPGQRSADLCHLSFPDFAGKPLSFLCARAAGRTLLARAFLTKTATSNSIQRFSEPTFRELPRRTLNAKRSLLIAEQTASDLQEEVHFHMTGHTFRTAHNISRVNTALSFHPPSLQFRVSALLMAYRSS